MIPFSIFASFNLPTYLAYKIHSNFNIKIKAAETVSQLITPCAIQLISTPLYPTYSTSQNQISSLGNSLHSMQDTENNISSDVLENGKDIPLPKYKRKYFKLKASLRSHQQVLHLSFNLNIIFIATCQNEGFGAKI